MFPNGYLSEHVKIIKLGNQAAAGTTAVVSDIVDMQAQGFKNVLFFSDIPTDAANNWMTIQGANSVTGGTASNGIISGATALSGDIAGSKNEAAANQDVVVTDIQEPEQRYLQATITRGTSTASGSIYALLYNAMSIPVTQPAKTLVEKFIRPALGTA